jgi:DNA-binding transcriptional LysR family regulator
MISIAYGGRVLHDVEIRHLQALDAVAREGSFGRAAERLGFTQSAISQQIAGLERAVGERVFDRRGGSRPVELTPAGEVLLSHAEAVLAQMRAAGDALRSLRAGEVGRLVVGAYQSVAVKVLPGVIGRLRVERPGLTIRCVEGDDNDELVAKLMDNELDLSFLVGPTHHEAIEAVELCVDPFVLVSPAGGDDRSVVPVSDLHGVPMIGQQPSSCQSLMDDAFRRCGFEPDYVFRTNDNSAVQAMVRAGMGRAVLPYLAVDANDPGVTIAELDPPFAPRVLFLARRRGRTLSPGADRFTELALEVCAALRRFEPVHASLVDA